MNFDRNFVSNSSDEGLISLSLIDFHLIIKFKWQKLAHSISKRLMISSFGLTRSGRINYGACALCLSKVKAKSVENGD